MTTALFEEEGLDTTLTTKLAAAAVSATGIIDDDDDAVDFGDEGLMQDDRLEKFIPSNGNVIRVNLLTDFLGLRKQWLHFVPGKGSYRCNTPRDKKTGRINGALAICCVKAEQIKNDEARKKALAKLVIAALAVRYVNVRPKDGAYVKDAQTGIVPAVQFKIGWVKLSQFAFRAITLMINMEEAEKASDFDVIISPDPKGGIGFAYTRLVSKFGSRIRVDKVALAELQEAVTPYLDGKELAGRLGKRVNEVEMAALWSSVAADKADDASVDDIS